MKLSLQTKVTAFIAVVVLMVSAITTLLSVQSHRASIEREVTARGVALSEALARSVDEGLAAENLNLIKSVEEIVLTDDVILTQVFSTLWLGVAAVQPGQLNVPPSPEAVRFFSRAGVTVHEHFARRENGWIDIYHPVVYDPHDTRVPNVLIGYVRLRISTEQADKAVVRAVVVNVLAAALLALAAVAALNALIRKYLLRPILDLHASVERHKDGALPALVPVYAQDEIGELSQEFNAMSLALKEREERLAEEKERLSVTLRSIGDAVIVCDVEGRVTLLNKVAEQYTGWNAVEAAGKPLAEIFPIVNEQTGEPCQQPVEKVIRTGLTCGLANHTVLVRKDGSRIVIEDSGAPIRDSASRIIGVVLVFRDVTEKRRIEEELIKAEKLQSVGLLAGGLAHDFNNLLTSIVGNISLAKMYVDGRSRAYDRLVEAETASRRATDLTTQLLTFSKGGAPVRRTSAIGDVIRESAGFALSGTSVAPEFRIDPDTWSVDIDSGQMSQVFSNLIINAVHAMPRGGTIVFSTSNLLLRENEVPTLCPGAYVRVSLQDSGPGIAAEVLPRIFEPYFTTKKKGSGLGLASVYSIVKRHDGHIIVESAPGRGATFHVYLPASAGNPIPARENEGGPSAGQGRVLVMDDDTSIREVAGEMLRMLGYEVDLAQSGSEAIELYQHAAASGRAYCVVIMDLTIPGGMGGTEALGRIRELDPGVCAVVSSGYSNDPVMADYGSFGFKGVIVKPYTIASFSKVLQEVLHPDGGGNLP